MTPTIELRPRGPYNLRMTVGAVRDGTLRLRDDGAELVFATAAGPAHARVAQRGDGDAAASPSTRPTRRARSTACASCWRWTTTSRPFLALAERDSLLAGPVARARGLRASRAGTCVHALVRALAGQLVTFSEARRIERGIVLPRRTRARRSHALARARGPRAPLGRRRVRLGPGPAPGGRARAHLVAARPRAPPDGRAGCRRGAARCASANSAPGPIGTFFLHGLGRYDRGLVGDLGLIKLCAALLGRRAEAEDTAKLLEPYGEWAGLASLHLLRSAPAAVRQERAPRARTASA